MRISDLFNDGAIPALEAMVRFSGGRQRLIAHNIANLSTPNYQQLDVSPAEFQNQLRIAIESRRGSSSGDKSEPLDLGHGSSGVRQMEDGSLELEPTLPRESRNILFHDRNNRGLEELMADQAENLAVFRVASDLLKSRHDMLRIAIAERV